MGVLRNQISISTANYTSEGLVIISQKKPLIQKAFLRCILRHNLSQ